MKATIESIAKECGLSTATVDRVLHNRPGVSASSKQRVLISARNVGYLPEDGATYLPSRPAHLEFLLPVGTNSFLKSLADQLEEVASRLPIVASCKVHRLNDLGPRHLLEAADNISSSASGVGIVAIDHPLTRELLNDLSNADIQVITIATDIPSVARSTYVGIDNRAAGRVAAQLMGRLIKHKNTNIAIFLGSRSYCGHDEREMGFRSIISTDFPHANIINTIEVHDVHQEGYLSALKLLDDYPDITGIYNIGGGSSGIVKALKERKRDQDIVMVCHDISVNSRRFLLDGSVDVVIDQNAHLTAEQSIFVLLGSIALPFGLTSKYIEPRIILRENIPIY